MPRRLELPRAGTSAQRPVLINWATTTAATATTTTIAIAFTFAAAIAAIAPSLAPSPPPTPSPPPSDVQLATSGSPPRVLADCTASSSSPDGARDARRTAAAAMSYFFSTPVDIDIVLEDADDRTMVDVKLDKNRREKAPLYMDGESVKGAVTVRPKDGKRLEHTGIKVQFIGTIEMFFDRGNHYEFLSLNQELAAPGELQHPQTFDFNFKNVEKQYESYNGINVKLRYFVRVTVSRRMADVIREKDIWVYSYRIPPEMNSSIKMDVGIEDCLHIEFEYSKSKYHLKDVIVGRIYFLLVRLKIKHMELSIIRRETTGAAPNQYNESETLVRFEIMDGSPSRGETIPIRLFLGGFDLTPTFRDVNKKFSTRYYLSLVLIDEGTPPLPTTSPSTSPPPQGSVLLTRCAQTPAATSSNLKSSSTAKPQTPYRQTRASSPCQSPMRREWPPPRPPPRNHESCAALGGLHSSRACDLCPSPSPPAPPPLLPSPPPTPPPSPPPHIPHIPSPFQHRAWRLSKA